MINRRKFIALSALGSATLLHKKPMASPASSGGIVGKPVVISTWNEGIEANKGAWKILSAGGRALDAVEAGVMVTEASQNCCVGLDANPDRDGFVTLDACIMDEFFNCGSVAFLEGSSILYPWQEE
jgi:N4-(beta-N-acetylglucosaminyl)-L-asparaginase